MLFSFITFFLDVKGGGNGLKPLLLFFLLRAIIPSIPIGPLHPLVRVSLNRYFFYSSRQNLQKIMRESEEGDKEIL